MLGDMGVCYVYRESARGKNEETAGKSGIDRQGYRQILTERDIMTQIDIETHEEAGKETDIGCNR